MRRIKDFKPCKRCGCTQRYVNKDGSTGGCPECHRSKQIKWRENNRDYSKTYAKNNRDQFNEYWRNWRDKNPEKIAKQRADYIKKNRDKNRVKNQARMKVKYAIRKGDIPKATTCMCADCEKPAREYHHPDYDKPLWVVPLCKACHVRRHASQVQGEVLGQAMPEMRGVSEICADSDSNTDEGTGKMCVLR